MEKEPTIFGPEAIAALVSEVGNEIGARTPEERTLLSEVLLRVLCEVYPIEAYQAIAHLTDSRVSDRQVMTLALAPDKTGLNDDQQDDVATAAFLYGMFKASRELASSEKTINAAGVFEWLRDLVAKRVEEKGPFDNASQYHMAAIAILTELAE